jgi:hypothetical protein
MTAGRPSGYPSARVNQVGSFHTTFIGTKTPPGIGYQILLLTRLRAHGDMEVCHNMGHPIRADDKT